MFGGYPMMGANLQNPGAGKRNEGDKWSWILNENLLFYKKHKETINKSAAPLLCYSPLLSKKCSSSILMNQYFGAHLSKSRVFLNIVVLIINIYV